MQFPILSASIGVLLRSIDFPKLPRPLLALSLLVEEAALAGGLADGGLLVIYETTFLAIGERVIERRLALDVAFEPVIEVKHLLIPWQAEGNTGV